MSTPQDLLALLHGKYSSLTIGFNDEHACNYETAEGWRDEYGFYTPTPAEGSMIHWASPEEREKAIRENSVWTIQWYPEAPVSFHYVGASTFEAAARFALEQEGRA